MLNPSWGCQSFSMSSKSLKSEVILAMICHSKIFLFLAVGGTMLVTKYNINNPKSAKGLINCTLYRRESQYFHLRGRLGNYVSYVCVGTTLICVFTCWSTCIQRSGIDDFSPCLYTNGQCFNDTNKNLKLCFVFLDLCFTLALVTHQYWNLHCL